jgi:phosphoglycerate dehydrogenase-like enzyme
MKAILHFNAGPLLLERLRAVTPAGLKVTVVSVNDDARFTSEMRDTDLLLHVLKPVTESIMSGAPKLRLIQKIGVGVNTIDLEVAARRGIAVANMPGTNSQAVAELTLALMLAALRRIVFLDQRMRAGEGWTLAPAALESAGEIHGRTVGLVGYGEVPRRLAPVLRALGAKIIYTASAPKPDALGDFLSLDQVVANSDILSLHMPVTDKTEKIIGRDMLKMMKRGSIIVNTARGELIDEDALFDNLRSGHLGAAGLDVFAKEPVGAGHPLYTLDNVVLTPHKAWLTTETIDRSLKVAFENARRLEAGEKLLHQVA